MSGPEQSVSALQQRSRLPRCSPHWEGVADFLISRPHWMYWRRELIEKNGESKWTKVPYQ
jgi:hypothetical protein